MAFNDPKTGIPGVSTNTPLFGFFPTTDYDINSTTMASGSTETVTDIFFRFNLLRKIVNNTSSYYVYNIDESDTPDLLAESVYGDIGAGWIILYANQIFDPQFDWPLNYDAFQKYIIDKYGSVANAQEELHHYEMQITRTNQFYGTSQTTSFVIDEQQMTQNMMKVPYYYYRPSVYDIYVTADSIAYTADSANLTADSSNTTPIVITEGGSVSAISSYNVYDVDGKTITESISAGRISNYDYEVKLNDDKKLIKVIKAEYYPQIMNEFKTFTRSQPNYLKGFA